MVAIQAGRKKIMYKKINWFLHVELRGFLLGLRTRYLNSVWGMNISHSARISLKAKLDFRNPKGIHIGDGSYLAFGSVILTHDMCRNIHKSVTIGKNCFIGANSILMPGVILGDSVIVGSGSVVTKSFTGNVIIAGNPAIIVKSGIKTRTLGILI
jgi:acetyltransferase-like isoleucine patch superfamily enzyme